MADLNIYDHPHPDWIDPAAARRHRHAGYNGPRNNAERAITWGAALAVLTMMGALVALFVIFVLAVGRVVL